MIDFRVNVFHHFIGDVASDGEAIKLLRAIKAQGEKLMATQQDALDALKKIDEATTKQALGLTALGDTLQEVNNDIDELILKVGTSVPQDVLDKLKATAEKTQAISDNLDQHAEFSKAIAAKWQTEPTPPPPPPPIEPPVEPPAGQRR